MRVWQRIGLTVQGKDAEELKAVETQCAAEDISGRDLVYIYARVRCVLTKAQEEEALLDEEKLDGRNKSH